MTNQMQAHYQVMQCISKHQTLKNYTSILPIVWCSPEVNGSLLKFVKQKNIYDVLHSVIYNSHNMCTKIVYNLLMVNHGLLPL